MATAKRKSKEQNFLKDYQKIMKASTMPPIPLKEPQWSNSGDFFVKFSLYQDIPSVASTDTSILHS